jgi:hypothetical protein
VTRTPRIAPASQAWMASLRRAGNYSSPLAFHGLGYFKYPSMAVMSLTDLRAVFAALIMCSPALAHDNGQFGDVPDNVRAWFKAVKSHQGVPCCDIADGHPTDFDIRENQYWVPINGTWMPVPPEAVIKDDGNPTGEAVVWYSAYGNQVYIRCFVPGDGA